MPRAALFVYVALAAVAAADPLCPMEIDVYVRNATVQTLGLRSTLPGHTAFAAVTVSNDALLTLVLRPLASHNARAYFDALHIRLDDLMFVHARDTRLPRPRAFSVDRTPAHRSRLIFEPDAFAACPLDPNPFRPNAASPQPSGCVITVDWDRGGARTRADGGFFVRELSANASAVDLAADAVFLLRATGTSPFATAHLAATHAALADAGPHARVFWAWPAYDWAAAGANADAPAHALLALSWSVVAT